MKNGKRIVDIDHANKQLSRLCKNPNRAKRQAMQREAAASPLPPRVAVLEKDPRRKKERS